MKKIIVIFLAILHMASFAENYKVTAGKLNVRANSDKNSEILGLLHQDEIVDLQGQTTSADGNVWGIISFNGQEGFVLMSYLESIPQEISSPPDKEKSSDKWLLIGLIFGLLFFILFRISKKKQKPIFMGIGDLITLIVALVSFSMFLFYITEDHTFDTTFFVIFLISFLISLFLTWRKHFSISQKVFSTCAKLAFLFSGVSFLALLFLGIIESTRRQNRGQESLWQELKEISKEHHIIANSDEDIDLE